MKFGIDRNSLSDFASEYNSRSNPIGSPDQNCAKAAYLKEKGHRGRKAWF